LYLPQSKVKSVDLLTDTGKPAAWKDIVLKAMTLEKLDPIPGGRVSLTFQPEGASYRLHVESDATLFSVPNLYPIVTSPSDQRLFGKYVGRKVWQYGGRSGSAVLADSSSTSSFNADVKRPFIVKRLFRVYGNMLLEEPTDNSGDGVFGMTYPLVAILEAERPLQMQAFDVSGSTLGGAWKLPAKMQHNLGIYDVYADEQQLARTFTFADPNTAHPEWPARLRRAVLRRDVEKGMTREMVALACGWPVDYGPIPEMIKRSEWNYPGYGGYQTVYFRNGKVSQVSPGGMGP
jgi:hypothetical protein